MEIYDEDSNTSNPDWSKMASKASNAGYKEGITSAKDALFQQGFDDGFAIGMKAGFSLGIFHGIHKYIYVLSGSSPNIEIQKTDESKDTALKANCQVCKNNDLLQMDTVKEVRDIQIKANEGKISEMYRKYEETLQKLGLQNNIQY